MSKLKELKRVRCILFVIILLISGRSNNPKIDSETSKIIIPDSGNGKVSSYDISTEHIIEVVTKDKTYWIEILNINEDNLNLLIKDLSTNTKIENNLGVGNEIKITSKELPRELSAVITLRSIYNERANIAIIRNDRL